MHETEELHHQCGGRGNRIQGCGRHDFMFPSSTVNGEVIYVETSSTQWMDGKNSKSGPYLSKYICIHENELVSEGNELCRREGRSNSPPFLSCARLKEYRLLGRPSSTKLPIRVQCTQQVRSKEVRNHASGVLLGALAGGKFLPRYALARPVRLE